MQIFVVFLPPVPVNILHHITEMRWWDNWFALSCICTSRFIYVRMWSEITPFVWTEIAVLKLMITIFFTGRQLLVLDAPAKGHKFN
jgi:hypothetical protein